MLIILQLVYLSLGGSSVKKDYYSIGNDFDSIDN